MKQYRWLPALLTIPGLLTLAVFAGGATRTEPRKQQTRGAYREQLDALISANKVPCKTPNDCEAVAIGSKSCGGPTEYLLVSRATRSKLGSDFDDNVKMITQLDVEANAGMMGTCEVLLKPEVACSAGSCTEAKSGPHAKPAAGSPAEKR